MVLKDKPYNSLRECACARASVTKDPTNASYHATIPRSASCDLVGSMITPSVFVPPTSTPIRKFFDEAMANDNRDDKPLPK